VFGSSDGLLDLQEVLSGLALGAFEVGGGLGEVGRVRVEEGALARGVAVRARSHGGGTSALAAASTPATSVVQSRPFDRILTPSYAIPRKIDSILVNL